MAGWTPTLPTWRPASTDQAARLDSDKSQLDPRFWLPAPSVRGGRPSDAASIGPRFPSGSPRRYHRWEKPSTSGPGALRSMSGPGDIVPP